MDWTRLCESRPIQHASYWKILNNMRFSLEILPVTYMKIGLLSQSRVQSISYIIVYAKDEGLKVELLDDEKRYDVFLSIVSLTCAWYIQLSIFPNSARTVLSYFIIRLCLPVDSFFACKTSMCQLHHLPRKRQVFRQPTGRLALQLRGTPPLNKVWPVRLATKRQRELVCSSELRRRILPMAWRGWDLH